MISQFRNLKDSKGNRFIILDNTSEEDEKNMGGRLSDYEIIQYLSTKNIDDCLCKVRSLRNNRIYAMKKISLAKLSEDEKNKLFIIVQKLMEINNPHIIKYYKTFKDNENNLYIIMEYMNNSDLFNFIKVHGELQMKIEETQIWNFLLQCFSALQYFHKRDDLLDLGVKFEKILMNDEENLKISVFNWPYRKGVIFNRDDDIFKLGTYFYALIFYKNKKIYEYNSISDIIPLRENNFEFSHELSNIIDDIIQNNDNKADIFRLFEKFKKYYNQKYKEKNNSVECVIRCLYAFPEIKNKYNNKENFAKYKENKEKYKINYLFSKACITMSGTSESELEEIFEEIRQYIIYENSNINNQNNIDPICVTAFLLHKMHSEENEIEVENKNGLSKINLLLNGEIEDQTNELQLLDNFNNYFNKNFKSPISNLFFGFKEIREICGKCNTFKYSFTDLCFISFEDARANYIDSLERRNNLFCGECKENNCERTETYYIRDQLIMTFDNRCENLDVQIKLDLSKYIDQKSQSPKMFELIGYITRENISNSDNNYNVFNYCYKEPDNSNWIGNADKNNIIMLFYIKTEKSN